MSRRSIAIALLIGALGGCSLVVDFDRTVLEDAGADGSLDGAAEVPTNGSMAGEGGRGGGPGEGGSAGGR